MLNGALRTVGMTTMRCDTIKSTRSGICGSTKGKSAIGCVITSTTNATIATTMMRTDTAAVKIGIAIATNIIAPTDQMQTNSSLVGLVCVPGRAAGFADFYRMCDLILALAHYMHNHS